MKNWVPMDGEAFLTRDNFIFYTFGQRIEMSGVLERVEHVKTGTHYQVLVGAATQEDEYIWTLSN